MPSQIAKPITEATDPRWVLAVRAAEQLQGAVLGSQQREKLIRLGKVMGLSAFDANLIVAIVQDRARRGNLPQDCPAAARQQLDMISHPDDAPAGRRHGALAVAGGVTALLVIEVIVLLAIF